jgi:hypothetical protein
MRLGEMPMLTSGEKGELQILTLQASSSLKTADDLMRNLMGRSRPTEEELFNDVDNKFAISPSVDSVIKAINNVYKKASEGREPHKTLQDYKAEIQALLQAFRREIVSMGTMGAGRDAERFLGTIQYLSMLIEPPRPQVVTETIGVSLSVGADGCMKQRISGLGAGAGSNRVVGIDLSIRAPSVAVPAAPRVATAVYASSSTVTAPASSEEDPHESRAGSPAEKSDFSLLIEACLKHPMKPGAGGRPVKYYMIEVLENLLRTEEAKATPDLKAIMNAIDDLELDEPRNPHFSIRQKVFGPCKGAIERIRRQCCEKVKDGSAVAAPQ